MKDKHSYLRDFHRSTHKSLTHLFPKKENKKNPNFNEIDAENMGVKGRCGSDQWKTLIRKNKT